MNRNALLADYFPRQLRSPRVLLLLLLSFALLGSPVVNSLLASDSYFTTVSDCSEVIADADDSDSDFAGIGSAVSNLSACRAGFVASHCFSDQSSIRLHQAIRAPPVLAG